MNQLQTHIERLQAHAETPVYLDDLVAIVTHLATHVQALGSASRAHSADAKAFEGVQASVEKLAHDLDALTKTVHAQTQALEDEPSQRKPKK